METANSVVAVFPRERAPRLERTRREGASWVGGGEGNMGEEWEVGMSAGVSGGWLGGGGLAGEGGEGWLEKGGALLVWMMSLMPIGRP